MRVDADVKHDYKYDYRIENLVEEMLENGDRALHTKKQIEITLYKNRERDNPEMTETITAIIDIELHNVSDRFLEKAQTKEEKEEE